jgi:large subunit ribosomal protein L21
MYAVVRTGGKQVRVQPGDLLDLDLVDGEPGQKIELAEVLLVGGETLSVGKPLVAGAKAVGTITAQGRGPKIRIFKMKRRKNYRRRNGHRQDFTEIRVEKIEG